MVVTISAISFFVVVCLFASYGQAPAENIVHPICITCIREVLGGWTGQGCDGRSCGPFSMTKPYWAEGGNLTVHGEPLTEDGVYERCATNEVCAIETVENVMKHQSKDCNNDGHIDCYDFIRIHIHGVNECHKPLSNAQYRQFEDCMISMPYELTGLVSANDESPPGKTLDISDTCLRCIRVIWLNVRVQPSECQLNNCGTYHIDQNYWSDAGSLTLNNEPKTAEGAFKRCAKNKECVERVVKNYITKYQRDCNNDGKVSCWDYIRIHMGPARCHARKFAASVRRRFYWCFRTNFS